MDHLRFHKLFLGADSGDGYGVFDGAHHNFPANIPTWKLFLEQEDDSLT
jgi:hypothetical protein